MKFKHILIIGIFITVIICASYFVAYSYVLPGITSANLGEAEYEAMIEGNRQVATYMKTGEIVAEYNGDLIYRWEIPMIKMQYESAGKSIRDDTHAIEEIAREKAIEHEAVRLGIGATQERINEVRAEIEERFIRMEEILESAPRNNDSLDEETLLFREYAEREMYEMELTGFDKEDLIECLVRSLVFMENYEVMSNYAREILYSPGFTSENSEINDLIAYVHRIQALPQEEMDALSMTDILIYTDSFLKVNDLYREAWFDSLFDRDKLFIYQ